MKTLLKNTTLFFIGGIIYYLIEIAWRGYSHWTMCLLGGFCFLCIGLINEFFTWEIKIWKQAIYGTALITVLEFFSGCIINIWLGWNVWDYSNVPFNVLGQICLPYIILWFPLTIVGIVLDDYLRYWLFNEEKPHYKIQHNLKT